MIAAGKDVLCVGNIVADVLVRPVRELVFNTTVWVDSIDHHIGGNGANTSFTLAKLGVPVRLHSAVGADEGGAALQQRLARVGVDLSRLTVLDGRTASTIVLVREDGARMFLHQPATASEAFTLMPEKSDLEQCGHLHLANCFSMPVLRQEAASILRAAKAAGLTTSLDTGWDSKGQWMSVVGPCLPSVDLFFSNEEEAEQLTGQRGDAAADVLLKAGCGVVVLKRGGEGCCLADGTGWRRSVPAFPVQVMDTTGAGDCFAGGFLTGLWRGMPLEEAARLANAVGALNVQQMGGVTGVLGYDETVQWMSAQPVSR